MKIDKTAATLVASLGGVLIGGTAVGVLLLSGGSGSSHTPEPVQTFQPAAQQTTPRATPTSAIVSSTRVTLKLPAKTQAAPKVQVATPNEETPVTDPTTDQSTDPGTPTDTPSDTPTDSPRVPPPPHNGASGSDVTAPPPIGAPSP